MKAPSTFSDVINLWPSAGKMAADVGVEPGVIRLWRHRDSIPAKFWNATISKARARGHRSVTADLLAALAAAKPVRKKAA